MPLGAPGDPLKAVLDGGVRGEGLALPRATAAGAERLARSFRPQDVDNLVAILGNAALATELRKCVAC
jgi:hypothetical protein